MSIEPDDTPATFVTDEQIELIDSKLATKDFAAALADIEQIPVAVRSPLLLSANALCLAEVKGNFKTAVTICHEAIKKEPKNPEHYFRQGRIMFLAGRRKDCIWILRMGLRHGKHRGIIEALGSLGIRRPPPLTFLSRTNPVNKFLGMIMTKLNFR